MLIALKGTNQILDSGGGKISKQFYVKEYIMNIIPNIRIYPPVSELKKKLSCFRDVIAYRIVISMADMSIFKSGTGKKRKLN